MAGRLIVSVSGIRDQTLSQLDDFSQQLAARGVPLSLFVAPRLKHGYRLESDPTTTEWLRQRRAGGDAVVVGSDSRLFAAPSWTTSSGTLIALPRNGFRLLVGPYAMVDLVRGTSCQGRVIGIGAGFLTEPWWCRTVVLSAERIARRGGTVRLAVSARQLGKPASRQAVLDAIDLALMHGCAPGVYRWDADPALAGAA
ncbi:MAG: DUF2334 domain-containing protein [Mycobacteriaceae bacterium]|nr:DUF2334 domain-containing protein [Mycobacteriaceae bacterium]